MKRNPITMAVLSATVALSPATRAAADIGDALVGGVIGGVIGGAIVNETQKKKAPRTVYVNPTNNVTRAQNREVQTSLNYFGFPAGTPDGVMGRNSRNAVSQYQIFMGYPATGYLTEYERSFLISSYHRAIAGGHATTQMVAANPLGPKGLLKTYQTEMAGGAAPQTTVVVAPQVVPAAPATTEASTNGAMPSFMGGNATVSLASHCNKVSLMTSTNGGFTTVSTMQDPNLALNEQFCLARTYAIAQGEELASKVQGFSTAQIEAQCEGFGPVLKEHVAALSLKPRDEVLKGVSGFVLNSGMSPEQLVGTAKICLSVGYRTDNMDVALGSALLLNALGEHVYGELPGHHLSQGIGASRRTDLSLAWYGSALDAVDAGATPAFAPGQPERNTLLRNAAFQLNGNGAAMKPADTVQPASLPSFAIQQ